MIASHRIIPVILSGGIGARLWPASRQLQPKQLLPLVGDRTMIRATVDRVASLGNAAPPIVVTNAEHADAIQHELGGAEQPHATLILEPVGRNTAPAVAVAAHEAMAGGTDPLLLVLPSDHTIADQAAFVEAVHHAAEAADSGYLVTFGITPERAETGYGYIKAGSQISTHVLAVEAFKEKPDATTASGYVDSGDFLWNSGMFLFRASKYLEELSAHDPVMAGLALEAWANATRDGHRVLLHPDAFGQIDGSSIDYTIMERTSMAAVVPTDPGWNDVGSWASLWDIAQHDAEGNVVIGDVVAVDVRDSYIRGGDRLVAVVGVEDIIVVDSQDAVLVTTRDNAQHVKQIVDRLASENRSELETDGTVLQPWGGFRNIASGPGFRVLHLWLDPGQETPIQVHENRRGHWQVLRGVARATIDGTTTQVRVKESAYIPAGAAHCLANGGDGVLEVIEVNIDMQIDDEVIARFLNDNGTAGSGS
jgi:mannose-1-phosphate guanylyltransferase/mannose-6-phosphate isomerase